MSRYISERFFRKYSIILMAFLLVIIFGFITLTQTYMLGELITGTEMTAEGISTEMTAEGVDTVSKEYNMEGRENLECWGGKIYAYYVSFLKVPREINILFGYGPATYTSRAAQYRMKKITYYVEKILGGRFGLSKEKIAFIYNYFELKTSKIYGKYLSKIKFKSNLNAPLTSIISIWVELGIFGIAFFILFFIYVFYRLKRANKFRVNLTEQPLFYRNDFIALLIIVLILNMFYYNYWEFPEMTIPIMTFVALSLDYNKKSK